MSFVSPAATCHICLHESLSSVAMVVTDVFFEKHRSRLWQHYLREWNVNLYNR
jgi:hypothetical protein